MEDLVTLSYIKAATALAAFTPITSEANFVWWWKKVVKSLLKTNPIAFTYTGNKGHSSPSPSSPSSASSPFWHSKFPITES